MVDAFTWNSVSCDNKNSASNIKNIEDVKSGFSIRNIVAIAFLLTFELL